MNRCTVRLAEPSSRLDERIQHALQVEGRAADNLEHIGGRGLLLERFAKLVEQPRVLNGDDRLGGECVQELDLRISKQASFSTTDRDSADGATSLEHRHSKNCTESGDRS